MCDLPWVNQIEIVVPFATNGRTSGDGSDMGLGDVAVAFKRALVHSLSRGRIFSVAGEVVFPTGSESKRLGSGAVVFEPFVAFSHGRSTTVLAYLLWDWYDGGLFSGW